MRLQNSRHQVDLPATFAYGNQLSNVYKRRDTGENAQVGWLGVEGLSAAYLNHRHCHYLTLLSGIPWLVLRKLHESRWTKLQGSR